MTFVRNHFQNFDKTKSFLSKSDFDYSLVNLRFAIINIWSWFSVNFVNFKLFVNRDYYNYKSLRRWYILYFSEAALEIHSMVGGVVLQTHVAHFFDSTFRRDFSAPMQVWLVSYHHRDQFQVLDWEVFDWTLQSFWTTVNCLNAIYIVITLIRRKNITMSLFCSSRAGSL